MESIELGPSDPILLMLRGDSNTAIYYSTVQEVGSDSIVIDPPTQASGTLELRVGDEVIYSVQSGGETTRLLVSRVTQVAPGWHVMLDMPRGVERRRFYRLELELSPSRAALIDPQGRDLEPLGDVVITNLSGGGLQLLSRSNIQPGRLIKMAFNLDRDRPELEVQVRVMSVEQGAADVHFVNGRFETVPQDVKAQIIGHIFRCRVSSLREEAVVRRRRPTIDGDWQLPRLTQGRSS